MQKKITKNKNKMQVHESNITNLTQGKLKFKEGFFINFKHLCFAKSITNTRLKIPIKLQRTNFYLEWTIDSSPCFQKEKTEFYIQWDC